MLLIAPWLTAKDRPNSGPSPNNRIVLVRVYFAVGPVVPVPLSRLQPSRPEPIEQWPWLDQEVLIPSRSRQVCLTCHFFRHHPAPECIPLLTCQLHQGLIAHGEHITHRCGGWTQEQHRQRGWAPEVA
jgi:hypothetical protein